MTRFSRRAFLRQAGQGAAAWSACAWLGPLREGPRGSDVLDLAAALRDASLDDGLRKIVLLHSRGWTRDELLGAVYVAGALDVESTLGGIAHCTMVVPSAMILADAAEPDEALAAVLFNYADFKRSQASDRSGGDFRMPRGPACEADPARAAAELPRALGAWDAEAADHAAVAAARGNDLDLLFEYLWPCGVHDFHSIGHKIIFTAHAYRTLARAGLAIAEPVLRSLAMGLLHGRGEQAATFEANRERAAALGPDWAAGREEAETSREVLHALRTVSAEEAPELVVGMIDDGVGPASLWGGLRLAAAELNIRSPGLAAVHALTSINAMDYAARTSKRPDTRALMLLSGASWTVFYRDFFAGNARSLRIDEIEPADPQDASSIVASDPTEAALACALATASTPDGRKDFFRSACRQVLRKGDQSHHYKYAAAVREETEKAHPMWAPYILAASISYLPRDADTAVYTNWRDGAYEPA